MKKSAIDRAIANGNKFLSGGLQQCYMDRKDIKKFVSILKAAKRDKARLDFLQSKQKGSGRTIRKAIDAAIRESEK